MEHNASARNKAASGAIETRRDTNGDIPWRLALAIAVMYSTYPINARGK